jgi:hypothetical protein
MKYNKKIVIFSFLSGIFFTLLFELVWFYFLPIPFLLSKKIIISYYMNIPTTPGTLDVKGLVGEPGSVHLIRPNHNGNRAGSGVSNKQ